MCTCAYPIHFVWVVFNACTHGHRIGLQALQKRHHAALDAIRNSAIEPNLRQISVLAPQLRQSSHTHILELALRHVDLAGEEGGGRLDVVPNGVQVEAILERIVERWSQACLAHLLRPKSCNVDADASRSPHVISIILAGGESDISRPKEKPCATND